MASDAVERLLDPDIVYGALAELVLQGADEDVVTCLENEDFRSRLASVLSVDRRVKERLGRILDLLPLDDASRVFLRKHMPGEPRPTTLVLGPAVISGFSCPLRVTLTRVKVPTSDVFDEVQLVNCTGSTLTRVTLFFGGERTLVGNLHAFQRRTFRRVADFTGERRLFVRADFYPEHEATEIFVVRCLVPEDFQ